MLLTDAVIRRKRPGAKPSRLTDGRGLYLLFHPSGGRWWRFDYRHAGKRRTVHLGSYPDVTILMARARLQEARRQLADGHDPAAAKRDQKRQLRAADSLETVAREWVCKYHPRLAPATRKKNLWLIDRVLVPTLGNRPIGAIEPPDVLAMLQTVEGRGRLETAHRLKQVTGQILRYAVATGRATRDATADLRGALAPVVPTHRPALTSPEEVGALLRALDGYHGSELTGIALRLAPLVFVRPGELRRAEWAELDLDGALWRIPAAKIKTRTDHIVPLAAQAVALFQEARRVGATGRYVFPGPRTVERPMSDNTLNAALRRLGYEQHEMTAHGFRALARTLLDEVLHEDPILIEVQLAHRVPGPLGATYNRSSYLQQRRDLMQRWADYLDQLRTLTRTRP